MGWAGSKTDPEEHCPGRYLEGTRFGPNRHAGTG